jgi:hypothetical protein
VNLLTFVNDVQSCVWQWLQLVGAIELVNSNVLRMHVEGYRWTAFPMLLDVVNFVCLFNWPEQRSSKFFRSLVVCPSVFKFLHFYAPLRRRWAYCFAPVGRSVGMSVGWSVGKPDDIRSIAWEPFIRLLWYFICGLVMSRGSPLLILRSIGQRSRLFELEIVIFCPLSILKTFH